MERDARQILSGYDLQNLASMCDTGKAVLEDVIAGGFTHPNIAKKIQNGVNLTDEEAAQLVSPVRVAIEKDEFSKGWGRMSFGKRRPDAQSCEYYNYKRHKYDRRQI